VLQIGYVIQQSAERADKRGVKTFQSLFVRYGSGAGVFLPLTQAKCWNVLAWSIIIVGMIGWAITLVIWNY
jgi:hypothetical protein